MIAIMFKIVMTNFVLIVAGLFSFKLVWDTTAKAPAWATIILGGLVVLQLILLVVFAILAIWS